MGNYNFLVVEDNPTVGMIMGAALQGLGQSTHVSNGVEGLARILANPETFDLVLTDNRMPGMSGMEMLQAMAGYESSQ